MLCTPGIRRARVARYAGNSSGCLCARSAEAQTLVLKPKQLLRDEKSNSPARPTAAEYILDEACHAAKDYAAGRVHQGARLLSSCFLEVQ